MSPFDVKQHYGNAYRFRKATGMSCSTLANWLKKGRVPLDAQQKLERLSEGRLKAEWNNG